MANATRVDLANDHFLVELDPGDWQGFRGKDIPRASFGSQVVYRCD